MSDDLNFDRWTLKTRQALFFSRREAGHLGSRSIEPAHVLLGLIRASGNLASRMFEHAGLSLEDARARLVNPAAGNEPLPDSVEMPFDEGTQRIVLAAAEAADSLAHREIGMVHLMMGILQEEGSPVTTILLDSGLNAQAARQNMEQWLDKTEDRPLPPFDWDS